MKKCNVYEFKLINVDVSIYPKCCGEASKVNYIGGINVIIRIETERLRYFIIKVAFQKNFSSIK